MLAAGALLVVSALASALVFFPFSAFRKTEAPPTARVAIPEGWTSFRIAQRMAAQQVCPEGAFIAATRDPELLAELGIVAPSVEGYLFPATYDLRVPSDPRAVVRQLVRQARQRLRALLEEHEAGFTRLHEELGWGEVEVLTLASIVEKEAMVDDERPLIASVYLNRLTDPEFRPEKRLQADPTAGYGCEVAPGEAPSCAGYRGKITPAMLRDPKNRYNTYRHPGLPPGPIANPGEASIVAVLDPAETEYLYFVATGRGRHVFSRTYREHNAAIERHQR